MEITNPLLYAVPIFLLLIVVELVFTLKHEKKIYKWQDLRASFSVGTGAAIISLSTKAFSLLLYFAVYNLFNPEIDGVRMNIMGYQAFGWAWYVWIMCQLCDDFSYYWFHRSNHTVRLFWAAHIPHHSSEKYNLGTGIRTGWFTLFYKPLFYLFIPAIGFHPIMVATCLAIESIWQFQLHTIFVPRLGFLEKFMNTHAHHKVHHSSKLEYLDKNHGGYLNIFDKMFGTFKDFDDEKENEYGVLHPPNSYHPWTIVSHEYKDIWKDFKKSKSLKERFMYVFGPPGWSPDGSTKTVKQMQKELETS